MCDSVKGLGITLDPSHYVYGPHGGVNYDQVMKHVYHVRLRDTTKDQLQVRVGQGDVEYGRLVNQLQQGPLRPGAVRRHAAHARGRSAHRDAQDAAAAGEPAVTSRVESGKSPDPRRRLSLLGEEIFQHVAGRGAATLGLRRGGLLELFFGLRRRLFCRLGRRFFLFLGLRLGFLR